MCLLQILSATNQHKVSLLRYSILFVYMKQAGVNACHYTINYHYIV